MQSLRWRPRLTYANVVSSVALFAAMGGGAYAASGGFADASGAIRLCVDHHGGVKVVKTGKKCAKGSSSVLVNQRGVAGAPGPQGAPGLSNGPAGGDLEGSYPNPTIGAGKVTSTKLAESAVTTTKLAANAVTNTKLAAESVSSTDIVDGQVKGSDLATITTVHATEKIAAGAQGQVSVECPAGTRVMDGGFQPANFGVEATSSFMEDNGWKYQAKNTSGGESQLTVFAYCLS